MSVPQASPRTVAASAAVSSYKIEIHPEACRFWGYCAFWVMVIVGVIITKSKYSSEQLDNSPLVQTFGYNNVCVFLDYESARGVGALLWIIAEYFLFAYVILNTLQFHFLYKQRNATQGSQSVPGEENKAIKPWQMYLVWFMFPFQAILIPTFRMIYVESPFEETQGMGLHYAPFAGLQWALVFICLQNYFYNLVDTRIKLPNWLNWLALAYLISLVVLTFIKQAFTLGAINEQPIWCSKGDCKTGARAAQAIDIVWMVLAAVSPIGLSWNAWKHTPPIRFTISMPDDRFKDAAHTKNTEAAQKRAEDAAKTLTNQKSGIELLAPPHPTLHPSSSNHDAVSSPVAAAASPVPEGSAASPVSIRYNDGNDVTIVTFNNNNDHQA